MECNVTCGGGSHHRYRTCYGVDNGGQQCEGNGRQDKPCGTIECPSRCQQRNRYLTYSLQCAYIILFVNFQSVENKYA